MKELSKEILIFLLISLSCVSRTELPPLEQGRYRGKSHALQEDIMEKPILIAREKIEGHLDGLRASAEKITGLKLTGFRYLYTSIDREKNILIIRYFSPLKERHKFYAGVQVQAIVDPESGRIKKLLVSKVPYE